MFDLIDCCQQKIISGYFILEMSTVAAYSWRAVPSGQLDTDASLCVRLFYADNGMEQAPVGKLPGWHRPSRSQPSR